ncbi:MAG: hypothetical protein PHE50_00875 [Dehalococcoidales bacterium]|nr:hypothetical protein [Dehalococcoidales bacterium]
MSTENQNKTIKKKRGGQPGNHNARTHGLYAFSLTANDMADYSQDVMGRGILPDVALVRAKLRAVILHSPLNRRALDDAAGLLANMYADKLRLNKSNTRQLKRVFWALLETCSLVADCENKTKNVSPEPIERTLPNE